MNKYWGGTAEGNQYNFGVKNLSYTLCLHASEAAHTLRKLRIMLDDKAPIKWYFRNSREQPSPARSGRLGHEPDQSFFSLMLHFKKQLSAWNDSNRSSVRKTSLPWDDACPGLAQNHKSQEATKRSAFTAGCLSLCASGSWGTCGFLL